MKKTLLNLLLVLVSTLIALLLAEVVIRAVNPVNVRSTWLQMHDRGFFVNNPGGNHLHTFEDRRVRYQFSPEGFRGEGINPDKKNILFFGDSFTFGLLVEEEDTITGNLRSLFDDHVPGHNLNLINGGIGGSGLADWVAFYEVFRDDLDVDAVVLVFNHSDVMRSLAKNLYVLKDDELLPSKRWEERKIKRILNRSSLYKWLQENSHIVSGFSTWSWSYMHPDLTNMFSQDETRVLIPTAEELETESDYVIRISSELLNRFRLMTQKDERTLLAVSTGFLVDEDLHAFDKRFHEHADSLFPFYDIPWKDLTPEVKEKAGGDLESVRIPVDRHPDEKGYQYAAESMFDFLINQPDIQNLLNPEHAD